MEHWNYRDLSKKTVKELENKYIDLESQVTDGIRLLRWLFDEIRERHEKLQKE